MSEWQECKLGDVVITNAKSIDKSYSIETIFYLDTGSITEGKIESFQEFSLKDAPSRAKRLAKPNDIVYSTVRPIQRHYGLLKNPQLNLVVSTGFTVIEANQKFAHPEFIYYLLSSDESVEYLDVIAEASTSTYPSLKPSDIENLDISLPPIEEQKTIASVLCGLDNKIDLLHRQNTTLERMAEALFRQWFIEEPQEDWEETTIAELVEFNPLRKLSKGKIAPYLDMAGLDTSTFSPSGWYLREFSSGTKFINNDTLLARITPCLENGKTGYVTFLSESEVGWGSTEFIVMRPKLGIHPFFAYVLARYQDFRDYAEGCMEGSSGRQRVNVDHLKQYQIRIPSNEIIKRFNEAVTVITPKLELNAKQIQILEKLRDNLLPKLMSGEVRVSIK